MNWQKNLQDLCQKKLPFSLDWLPESAYLVGGSVRDALLNRKKENLDLDFVIPTQAIEIARKIAHHFQAGFVILDEQRQMARVVLSNLTIDFAQQFGDKLETDLARRDYTINAIAYNPHRGELYDPLQGRVDLQKKQIRMISVKNLQDDPLRLLRAYRQAAQLNFNIDPNTRATIKNLAPLISEIAAERVQTEINYLLASPSGSDWLTLAWEDNLLSVWFKKLDREKIKQLEKVEKAGKWMQTTWWQFADPNSSWYELAKLAILVSSEPRFAETELSQLKYSRTEIRTVVTALKYLPQLLETKTLISLKKQYFLFLQLGDIFPTLAVLALAAEVNQEIITSLINRYLNPNDAVAHPQKIVTGNELMTYFQLPPSPLIGYILSEIQIAYIEGQISTPEEAFQFAQSLIKHQ